MHLEQRIIDAIAIYSTPVPRKTALVAIRSERTSGMSPISARINNNMTAMKLPKTRNMQKTAILKSCAFGNGTAGSGPYEYVSGGKRLLHQLETAAVSGPIATPARKVITKAIRKSVIRPLSQIKCTRAVLDTRAARCITRGFLDRRVRGQESLVQIYVSRPRFLAAPRKMEASSVAQPRDMRQHL